MKRFLVVMAIVVAPLVAAADFFPTWPPSNTGGTQINTPVKNSTVNGILAVCDGGMLCQDTTHLSWNRQTSTLAATTIASGTVNITTLSAGDGGLTVSSAGVVRVPGTQNAGTMTVVFDNDGGHNMVTAVVPSGSICLVSDKTSSVRPFTYDVSATVLTVTSSVDAGGDVMSYHCF